VIGDQVDIGIDVQTWRRPRIFEEIASKGPVSETEMRNVFNLGIGMVLIVPSDQIDAIIGLADMNGHEAWVIGQVTEGRGQVRWMDQ